MAAPQGASRPAAALEGLIARPPVLHGPVTHGLVEGALLWIAALPRPLRTLETGCGISTLVFAVRGDQHICITPSQDEVDRVEAYCTAHQIDATGLTFEVERSEVALPGLESEPLDLVLIDGSHAFPQVFLDWMYTAARVRVGGTVIVDDVHLWTGKILRDFLASEPEWELVQEWIGRTVAFRKLGDAPYRDWFDQRFVRRRSTPARIRLRMSASLVRQGDFSTLRELAQGLLRRR